MANSYEYELGTSPHPPNASPSAGAKFSVFIVVIATIGAGAWFYFSRMNSGQVPSEAVADSAQATPTAQSAATGSPATPTPAATGATAAGKSAQPNAPPPAGQPRAQRVNRPLATIPAETTPATSPSPALQAPVQPARQPAVASPTRERATSPRPVSWPDAPIYDRAADGVTPPSLLTPIGIAPVRTNYVPGLATIEVIVGGDGSVQSAKAGRPPVTVGETLEMMNWLSAAKSWLFGPAMRNGQPVNYRLVVPLSALVSGQGIR